MLGCLTWVFEESLHDTDATFIYTVTRSFLFSLGVCVYVYMTPFENLVQVQDPDTVQNQDSHMTSHIGTKTQIPVS